MKMFSRLFVDAAIQIKGGKAILLKGRVKAKTMREVSLLCSDLSIESCEIWINAVGKVTFSKEIDKKFYQRFRNVLCG